MARFTEYLFGMETTRLLCAEENEAKNRPKYKSFRLDHYHKDKFTKQPTFLVSSSGIKYYFPPSLILDSSQSLKLTQLLKNGSIEVLLEEQRRIHRIGDISFCWDDKPEEKPEEKPVLQDYQMGEYSLRIISCTKGMILKCPIKTTSVLKVNEFFKKYGLSPLIDKDYDEITVIIEDILTFAIPGVID